MAFPNGFYRSQPVTELQNIGGVSVEEKFEQLFSMIGRQQDVIADFSRENKDLRTSLSEMQCNVDSLGSDLSSFKDSVTSNAPTQLKKASTRLDS